VLAASVSAQPQTQLREPLQTTFVSRLCPVRETCRTTRRHMDMYSPTRLPFWTSLSVPSVPLPLRCRRLTWISAGPVPVMIAQRSICRRLRGYSPQGQRCDWQACLSKVHVSHDDEWQNGRSWPPWLTCKLSAAGYCLQRLPHAADAAAVCAAAPAAGSPTARRLAAGRPHHIATAAAVCAAAATASGPATWPMAAERLCHDTTTAALRATAATAGKSTARPLAAGRLQHRS
jgi:hypothetical protein